LRQQALLGNHEGDDGRGVEAALDRVLERIEAARTEAGELQPALGHFLKVTRSYRPGLFHC